MSKSLKSYYTIKDLDQLEIDLHTKHQIQDLILSPRSTYIKKYRKKGFVICQSCNYAYCKGDLPQYSIANNFFGTPPECLTSLTDIELAMISPVKTFGIALVTQVVFKNIKRKRIILQSQI